MHSTPWSVKYWQRCPEWHEQSNPRVVDVNGVIVCELPQNVGHPGEYDEEADNTAKLIVESVNEYARQADFEGRIS